MPPSPTLLDNEDLSAIRDAVPALDLLAIRSLRRAGFQIVRRDPEAAPADPPAPRQGGDPERPRGSSF